MGRGRVLLRAGGEVISGGSGGWFGFGFEPGDGMAGGEVAGDDDDGDMIAAMLLLLAEGLNFADGMCLFAG